jgi:hypothetical protein
MSGPLIGRFERVAVIAQGRPDHPSECKVHDSRRLPVKEKYWGFLETVKIRGRAFATLEGGLRLTG